jgi:hypothetical protein
MDYLKNRVKLEDGIIFYTQAGDQDQEVALNTLSVIRFLAGGLSEVKMLVDYSKSGHMTEAAIEQGYYALQVLPLDKVAIIGASPQMVELVTEMANLAGKSQAIHFADNRAAALAWLKH